jgi:hypothetical protein
MSFFEWPLDNSMRIFFFMPDQGFWPSGTGIRLISKTDAFGLVRCLLFNIFLCDGHRAAPLANIQMLLIPGDSLKNRLRQSSAGNPNFA